jgi:hypothetical protein
VLQDPNILSVSGRVATNAGGVVGKAFVVLTGLNGQTYRAVPGPLGYFRIEGVPAGLNGTLTVVTKEGPAFSPRPIAVTDVIDNLELRALP